MRIKFVFSLLFLLLFYSSLYGQVSDVYVGINGLTCSQCSRSVEMQLRKLSFVKDVDMNLQTTNAHVVLKKSNICDFSGLEKAVKNSGFSLRDIVVSFDLSHESVQNGLHCFSWKGDKYIWTNKLEFSDTGKVKMRIVAVKDLKRKERLLLNIPKNFDCKGNKTYYVTLI